MSITEEIKSLLIRKKQLSEEISNLYLPIFDKFRYSSDTYDIDQMTFDDFIDSIKSINNSSCFDKKINLTDDIEKSIIVSFEKESNIYKNLNEEVNEVKDSLFNFFFSNRNNDKSNEIFTSIYMIDKKGGIKPEIENIINQNKNVFCLIDENKEYSHGLLFGYNDKDIISLLKNINNEEHRLNLKGDNRFKVSYDGNNPVQIYNYLTSWDSEVMLGSNMEEIVNEKNLEKEINNTFLKV